ncbi:MAG TPA: hypothetical protein VFD36_20675 [Kofleriaceae bacterium]|nr:hypothetical protein [Kofleriaceae bacterium]
MSDKIKVHKVTLLVIDHECIGFNGITDLIEEARYAGRSIAPVVMEIDTREVEWSDSHPLNQSDTQVEAFDELFEDDEDDDDADEDE